VPFSIILVGEFCVTIYTLINKTSEPRSLNIQGKFAGKPSKTVSFTLDEKLSDLTQAEGKAGKKILLNPYSLTFIE
ncbi:MAG: hypothetical protein ACI4TU_09345, partial [Candidatus Cryptobacteroides sp.]